MLGVSERLEVWSGPAWDRYEAARAGAYVSGALALLAWSTRTFQNRA